MAYQRNDWISTSPSSGVRLADLVLKAGPNGLAESIATELPRLDDGTMVLAVRLLTSGLIGAPQILEKVLTLQRCHTCGEEMLRDPYSRSWKADHCQTCNREIKRSSNRKAAKTYRINNGLVKTLLFVECAHCGNRFVPKRSTATFCSTKCRVANHRATQSNPAPCLT